jgi:hypothetical protein
MDEYRVMECAITPNGAYVKTRLTTSNRDDAMVVYHTIDFTGPTGLVRRPEVILLYSYQGGRMILESREIQTLAANVADKTWRRLVGATQI